MNIEQLPVNTQDVIALAEKYKKDIVVVLAYNVDFDILTMNSYGVGAQEQKAAQWGERAAEFLGGDLRSATWHEDCRPSDNSMADLQAKVEYLKTALENLTNSGPLSFAQVCTFATRALSILPTIKRNETTLLPRVS